MRVLLGRGAYDRPYQQNFVLELQNRFFEEAPNSPEDDTALLTRPGSTLEVTIGAGPITKLFTQPGAFGGDMFAVSGDELYRYDGENPPILINGVIQPGVTQSMAVTTGIGYELLFIADGLNLYYYAGVSFATGTLTAAGAIIDADVIEINGTYYKWTAGSVDAGTPAGTLANPFLVALGASTTIALANMLKALNFTGISGTDYSTALGGFNVDVEATGSTATTLSIKARVAGSAANAYTTTETGANISWGGGTLAGGGAHTLVQVITPDDVPISSVASLNGFAVAVQAASNRFFWILPGTTVINPLHFASAEQSPDTIINAIVVGDRIWFLGDDSVESWYVEGTPDLALLPDQGLVFDQGVIPGTAVQVKDFVVLVGEDGVVYSIAGGKQRISHHGVENQIRLALEEERAQA